MAQPPLSNFANTQKISIWLRRRDLTPVLLHLLLEPPSTQIIDFSSHSEKLSA